MPMIEQEKRNALRMQPLLALRRALINTITDEDVRKAQRIPWIIGKPCRGCGELIETPIDVPAVCGGCVEKWR